MISHVSKFCTLDIVWNRSPFFGHRRNFAGGYVNEFRKWIDKTADQPWAGNAVDLWMLASDPSIVGAAKIPPGGETASPARNASFKIGSRNAGRAQRHRYSWADFLPMHAVNYDRKTRQQVVHPMLDVIWSAME